MPELPEVETIRGMLLPSVGRRLKSSRISLGRILIGAAPRAFDAHCRGHTIRGILRRGKYLIVEFEGPAVVFHMGMTGQLIMAPGEARNPGRFRRTPSGLQVAEGPHRPDAHTHLVWTFENGDRLQYRDVRTLGKILWFPDGDWHTHPRLAKLGPDPLSISRGDFISRGTGLASRRSIKAVLLDQSFVAGVGNIYADESFWEARLHPRLPARNLTGSAWGALWRALRRCLLGGIQNAGTTFRDYRRPDDSPGANYERLRVYGRAGRPCPRCQTPLVKTVVAHRGTVHCPACQRPGAGERTRRAAA